MAKKEKINGLPKDLPNEALDAMRQSIAKEANVAVEDVVFDGDVVRLVNGDVIGQIKTEKIGSGAMGVSISGKRRGDKFEVIDIDDMLAKLTGEDKKDKTLNPMEIIEKQRELVNKLTEANVHANEVVIEALGDIADMATKLKMLMKDLNKSLSDTIDK